MMLASCEIRSDERRDASKAKGHVEGEAAQPTDTANAL